MARRQGLQMAFAVRCRRMHRSIHLAEEEAEARGLKRVRPEHQRYLPGLWKETPVNGEVCVRQENFTTRVRVIPAYRAKAAGAAIVSGQQVR